MKDNLCTCGIIYRVKDTNIFLIEHATMSKYWSIPKGCLESSDKSKAEAAVREIKEETNIDINKDSLKYIGTYHYVKGKDIALFTYEVEHSSAININKLVCTSMFDYKYKTSDGNLKVISLPEVDKYRYINHMEMSKYLNENICRVLKENIEWI